MWMRTSVDKGQSGSIRLPLQVISPNITNVCEGQERLMGTTFLGQQENNLGELRVDQLEAQSESSQNTWRRKMVFYQ